jgi:glycosyltransferase involved in cell wall biosynthesis
MRYWPDDVCFVMKSIVRPAFATELQALARDEGMADRVLIHSPGFQGYADHLAFIVGADLGWTALAPVGNNWKYSAYASNKRFECMALGVPQVTDRGPLLPEMIEGGGCGICVPLDDPRGVGMAIASALNDPSCLAAMCVAGRRLHLQQYNYDRQFEPVLRWLSRSGCPTKVHEGDED